MSEQKNSVRECVERVGTTLEVLATGTGVLQTRLADSMISGIGTLDPRDFPTDLRPAFAAIMSVMTAGGSFEATAAGMSTDKAAAVATRIWQLGHTVIQRDALEDPEGVE